MKSLTSPFSFLQIVSEKEKASPPPPPTPPLTNVRSTNNRTTNNRNTNAKEPLVKKEKVEVATTTPAATTQKSNAKSRRNVKNHDEKVVLYCLCREPERPGMIGCDFCEEWYHSSCLNLKKEDVKQLTKCKWKCPKCELTDSKQAKALEQKATDAISTTESEEESKEPSGRKTR